MRNLLSKGVQWLGVGLILGLTPAFATEVAFLSDIHVFAVSEKFPDAAQAIVQDLLKRKPDAVILAGDTTSGNPADGVKIEKARKWWQSVSLALNPLRAAGIPVLAIPGNHDFYTDVHRQAYREEWRPEKWAPNVRYEGEFGVRYAVTLGEDLEIFLLPIVDQSVSGETLRWLGEVSRKTAGLPSKRARISVAHVPLASRMGKTQPAFQRDFGGALVQAGVHFHVSGHEHLTWDEILEVGSPPTPLRQIWLGTASGTYTFPLRQSVWEQNCREEGGSLCRMPTHGRGFRVDPKTREQAHRVVYGWFSTRAQGDTREPSLEIRALHSNGSFVDFYETP